jgi:hypothetical protein
MRPPQRKVSSAGRRLSSMYNWSKVTWLCRGSYFLLHSREKPSPKGLNNIKNPQFQEEKISARKQGRNQVNMEKSSKNLISVFGEKPARWLPMRNWVQ